MATKPNVIYLKKVDQYPIGEAHQPMAMNPANDRSNNPYRQARAK